MFDIFGSASRRTKAKTSTSVGHPGWPEATRSVILTDGGMLRLRPLTSGDYPYWAELRLGDEDQLRTVEPTVPSTWANAHNRSAWWDNFLYLRRSANAGTIVPFVIEVDDYFVGQVTIGNIQHGSISDAWIGYWVHSSATGRGVATAACALGTDHAFERIGLHRVTATYLPNNPASGKVLAANGFREEGYLRRNLHIDGNWRDHHLVAQLRGEYGMTCVERLVRSGKIRAN